MTIVPLAIVSGVWTASLAGLGTAATAVDAKIEPKLPDGATVPSQAIEAPANLSANGVVAPGVPNGASESVVDGASTSGIPSSALSAYQRAAQIINSADAGCKIPWELIAGIGRVESDHGRYGGNVLSSKGVSTPGIYGIPLNGTNGTTKVPDTDGGELDKDTVWDRAVGPMQFIPSTWSSVKVDADNDGMRNPQDIDDASLATAVYLCSGSDDLSTTAGQQRSVFRYNHSQDYVDLVLSLMRAYSQGDYTAVPDAAAGGATYSLSTPSGATYTGNGKAAKGAKAGKAKGSAATTPTAKSTTAAKGSTGSTGSTGSKSGSIFPDEPSSSPSSGSGVKTPAAKAAAPVVKTLNQLGQTTSFCTTQLGTYANVPGALSACVNRVGGMTKAAADDLLGTPAQILTLLGIKVPLAGGVGIGGL